MAICLGIPPSTIASSWSSLTVILPPLFGYISKVGGFCDLSLKFTRNHALLFQVVNLNKPLLDERY